MAEVREADAASASADQISLACSAEYMSYPITEQTCWSVTSFKAPFFEPTSRASVDIVAVIDKSGSMSGEKIKLVRETLLFVIDQCKLILTMANFFSNLVHVVINSFLCLALEKKYDCLNR